MKHQEINATCNHFGAALIASYLSPKTIRQGLEDIPEAVGQLYKEEEL